MSDSVFTKILNGEIPSDIIYQDDLCFAIFDISPQAPTHILIIPKKAICKLSDAEAKDKALMGHLLWVAGELARKHQIDEGFRLIINNGEQAGQTVFHLHLHLLGGKAFQESNL